MVNVIRILTNIDYNLNMNIYKIFILVFLSFTIVSCGSSESKEMEINNNQSEIANKKNNFEKKVLPTVVPTITLTQIPLSSKSNIPSNNQSEIANKKNNFEKKVLPTVVRSSNEKIERPKFYPTVIPTITPTPTPTYPANTIVFENLEFENYIKEKIGKSLLDPYITLEDISKITEIEIGGVIGQINLNNKISMEHIRDLKYFKNLERLVIREAGINDIDGIEELQNLEHLDLSFNNIENIELISLLGNLETLFLYDNKISDIWAFTPEKTPYLRSLWLDGNNISSIGPFVPSINEFAKQITHIGISRNPIVSENWDKAFSENTVSLQILEIGIDDKILKELFSQKHGFPNLRYINLLQNNKIKNLRPLLELKALESVTLGSKVEGSALNRLLRDEGIDNLLEKGVKVNII